jgi:hypothetical protein
VNLVQVGPDWFISTPWERNMKPYEASHPVGSTVRIARLPVLEDFLRSWKYHNPLSPEQLQFAGKSRKSRESVSTMGAIHSMCWRMFPASGTRDVFGARPTNPVVGNRRGFLNVQYLP